jgi:hypothetical protein
MDKDYLKKYLGKAFTFKGGSPTVFVTEVFYEKVSKDGVNETSGFPKFKKGDDSLKFKAIWFFENKREAGFKEVFLYENETIEFHKVKRVNPRYIRYHLSSESFDELKFGQRIDCPKIVEKTIQAINGKEEEEKIITLFPGLTLVDIERNKEQSKFGSLTIIRPEYFVKCKWYNNVSGKFQEKMLPKEFFIQPIISPLESKLV